MRRTVDVPAGGRIGHDGPVRTVDSGPDAAEARVVSIGYEGKTVAQLLAQDVKVLVDVRLTPLSRKPGLSKTKLAEALRAAGIDYLALLRRNTLPRRLPALSDGD